MLTGLSLPMVALLALAGMALDALLGETRRWHPLVGFGNWANAIERRLNCGATRFWRGVLAWGLAVLPFTLLALWLTGIGNTGLALHALLLYFCVGLRSLREHTMPIAQALLRGDLAQARQLTSYIVSRDTQAAQEADLSKAAAESLLENGNDAVFGTLFWFVVAGGPGALLFRLANTLDAMWGYRSSRFLAFGCFAARFDDVLNWIPARLTALSYVLLAATMADKRRAWHCWRTQAPDWSSPNAGPVMASGAGALGLALGGAATYDGELEQRPPLGLGHAAAAADIGRAWRLVAATAVLWVAVLGLAGLLRL
ncbi:MAG: adenosylcobinamide-phosphate synthase CbiB [Oxalobacteraceae bacterium]|nr:adenosylcobinamide-phosphate synthase CbiB [Oxalobacteraceae bacterium]